MSKSTLHYGIRDIDSAFWRRVKIGCAQEGISIKDKILALLDAWINEKEDRK